jgi:hypothetical protein
VKVHELNVKSLSLDEDDNTRENEFPKIPNEIQSMLAVPTSQKVSEEYGEIKGIKKIEKAKEIKSKVNDNIPKNTNIRINPKKNEHIGSNENILVLHAKTAKRQSPNLKHIPDLNEKDLNETILNKSNQLISRKQSGSIVKEMPSNPFDFIWNANDILEKLEDIDKNYNLNLSRSKSNLIGGKKAQSLNSTEIHLFNRNLTEYSSSNLFSSSFLSNNFSKDSSLNINGKKTKSKSKNKKKSNESKINQQDTF